MAYVRRSGAPALSPETVELMARVVGLAVPPEDLGPLTTQLTDQLASIAALERLDLTHVDPVLCFDPRWPAGGGGHERSHQSDHT